MKCICPLITFDRLTFGTSISRISHPWHHGHVGLENYLLVGMCFSCRVFSSITGFYPLGTQISTNEKCLQTLNRCVQGCRMGWDEICPRWRMTVLSNRTSQLPQDGWNAPEAALLVPLCFPFSLFIHIHTQVYTHTTPTLPLPPK